MRNLKIEISFEDLVCDLFDSAAGDEYGMSPTLTFQEALKEDIVRQISSQIKSEIRDESTREIAKLAKDKVASFVEGELSGIISRKLRAGEIRTAYDGFKSFDDLIEKKLDRMNIERVIENHIGVKADQFAKEMKARYDNVFAARIVGSLNEQKMLSPDVAKILLGE